MGIIRGGALVIVSILFLVSMISLNVFWTLGNSLEFNNIKTELIPVVMNLAGNSVNISQVIDTSYPLMQTYCENNSDFTMGEGEMTFVITCDTVRLGKQAVIDGIIDSSISSIYSKEYDCDFFDCFEKYGQTPFFLVSKQTHNYFNSKFYLMMFLSIVLLGLMCLFTEERSNAFILSGALAILAGLPFAKLNWVLGMFAQKEYLQFFTFMFTQASSVFIKCLILGIVLIVLGILWKMFSVGMKISDFFNKDKEEKKEVKNNKK